MDNEQSTQPATNSFPQAKPLHPLSPVAIGVGIGAVIILCIVGWFLLSNRRNSSPLPTEPTVLTDDVVTSLKTQGTSDEIPSIEKDLTATDLHVLDVSEL